MRTARTLLPLIILTALTGLGGRVLAQKADASTGTLPYFCNFASETEIEDNWLVDDANGDLCSWKLDWWADDDQTYHAMLSTGYDVSEDLPESLITGRPFSLQAGQKYHIGFYVETHFYSLETFEVRYGTSSTPSQMTVLRRYENVNEGEEFARYSINFSPEQDGDYYFAFTAYNIENPDLSSFYGPYVLYIDNVEIAEGEDNRMEAPDLQLNRIAWPVSSCALTDNEELIINVCNIGRGNLQKFRVSGRVAGQTVDKVLEAAMESRSKDTNILIGNYDFSGTGSYEIELTVSVIADGEQYLADPNADNNTVKTVVQHWEPVDLPLISDFAQDSTAFNNWKQEEGENWQYVWTGWSGYLHPTRTDVPLYSRCFNLTAGTEYRLEVTYFAGWKFRQYIYYDDFKIMCGKSGSNPGSYQTILEVKDGYTNDERETACIPFTVDESGVYDLIIIFTHTESNALSFYGVNLYENPACDLHADAISSMPPMIPAGQFNGTYGIDVTLTNRGAELAKNAKIEIYSKAGKLGEHTLTNVFPGATVTATVPVNVAGAEAGPDTLKAVVSTPGREDAFPSDNTVSSLPFTVTDIILGYDHWENWMMNWDGYLVGNGYSLITFGMPFFVNTEDTLTHIRMLWGQGPTFQTEVGVYSFDAQNETLGRMLYKGLFTKQEEAGYQVFDIDDLILERGWYFISAQADDYVVAVDRMLPNRLYSVVDGELILQISDDMGIPFGTPVMHALFDYNGRPVNSANGKTTESGPAFILYPNPAGGQFTVEIRETARMEIYNIAGNKLQSRVLSGGKHTVSLSRSGLYLIRMTDAGGRTSTRRLIITD